MVVRHLFAAPLCGWLAVATCSFGGCHSPRPGPAPATWDTPPITAAATPLANAQSSARPVEQAAYPRAEAVVRPAQYAEFAPALSAQEHPLDAEDADSLVAAALAANPRLRRLQADASAAWERVPQVRALPDPMARGTVFGEPMMMADGEARGVFMISQTLPYWKQLDAQGQQAMLEALMMEHELQAAQWSIAADVQEAWHRLYLLGQLLRINQSNQQLVESLVKTASARVEVGGATPGDVVLGMLELSRIEEERLMLRRQLAARQAELNRLLNRPADARLEIPAALDDPAVDFSLDELRTLAFERQPEILAARLRAQAAAWGIRIAEWERVPEVTLSYEHMFMKMNPGEHGGDPWQVGVGINLPIWRQKYGALRREAAQRHYSASAAVDETQRATEAMLLDLLEEARAADRTARLYRETILPQARQALEADQRAYAQGAVQFERVIADAQTLLTAEAAYQRARSERAIAAARLEQTVGARLAGPAGEPTIPAPLWELTPRPPRELD